MNDWHADMDFYGVFFLSLEPCCGTVWCLPVCGVTTLVVPAGVHVFIVHSRKWVWITEEINIDAQTRNVLRNERSWRTHYTRNQQLCRSVGRSFFSRHWTLWSECCTNNCIRLHCPSTRCVWFRLRNCWPALDILIQNLFVFVQALANQTDHRVRCKWLSDVGA